LPTTAGDYSASGALTATGTVAVQVNGTSTVFVSVSGTGAGLAFSFQCYDGTAWQSIYAWPLSGGALGTAVTTGSANGNWFINSAGCAATSNTGVRVNLTAITSGTATIKLNASAGDGPSSVALLPGSNTIGALSANQSINLAQRGGTNIVADPCESLAKSYVKISVTANTQLITGTSGKQTYFCSMNVGAAAPVNVAIVEGTGSTCGTGTLGTVSGGATAATGWNFAANGGLTYGDGRAAVGATATGGGGANVCIFVSAAVQVSGNIGYVQQ